MAKSLQINTGVVEYRLNDTVSVWLNPADPAFVKRISDRFTALEQEDKAWREKLQAIEDPVEVMAAYDEGDKIFRNAIDDLLGEGTCQALLGNVSVLAFADGSPIWMNILLAVIDIIDEAMEQEQAKTNPKLEMYLKKYRKKK